ncbi:MAG: SprB repeat-containing protein, partial [Chitinophagaceae bacterium]|nr:SprB repeat-containing protein [Chitinophagaceae bacterium]
MKKVCTIFIIIFLNVLSVQKLFATHAAGGELIYTLVPNTTNQYEFTFKFYRDCSGVAEPSTFTMCYNNTCGVTNQSVTLSKIIGNLPNGQPNGSPIVQVGCYNQATICQGGVVAGYREWWYTGTVTLNSTCNFWRFWVSLCCRNNAIGNVITPGSQNIFIETDFDNTINLNSSPFVASPPIAYYCVNTPSFAYYTAIDPDGDSIAYESIAPQHNNAGCNNLAPVNIFSAPYTIAEPFPTGNTFNIDPVTGVISFTPTTQGAWVFSVKIKEYRNGQYIGYVMRDIQFVVSVCNLPPPLSVFATYAPITCYGDLTAVTGIGNGGITPYQYQLNGGGFQPGNQFNGIGAGIYTITVMDANNCTSSTVFTITEPPPFLLTINNIIDPACNMPCSGRAQSGIVGGVSPYQYSITAPGIIDINTGLISGLCAGAYTVTVTDANGCTATSTLNVVQPTLGVSVSMQNNITCYGSCNGTAQASNIGGVNPISYAISAPAVINAATGSISALCAGTYTITITDATTCTGTTILTVTEPPLLTITVSNIINETCNGACNGSSQSTASGGTLPYTYAISAPGNTNASGFNSALCGGTYTVTVTDANGCTASSTFAVAQAQLLTLAFSNILNVTCNGLCDGSSQVAAAGGNAPYNYTISPAGNINAVSGAATALCAGVFTVSVTDANGCSASGTFNITEPPVLTLTINNINNVLCAGDCNGTAQALASGGATPFVYSVNSPGIINANTGALSALCAGSYTVTVNDVNGCSSSAVFQVTEPAALAWANTTAVNVNCHGGSDGSISTTATGGTGTINYTLQPNNITNISGQFTNLIAGVYTVSAVDANGCSISTVLTITEPVLLQLTNLANTQPTCVPGNDGSLTVTASGGTPAYTYNIGGANQASNVFLNLGAGNYTVTVTDANGCTASSTITIAAPNSPVISAVLTTDVTCNGGNDGAITATASGGLGALNYNLQPGNVNNASGVFSNLTAGIYTITVGDANGCTVSSTAIIAQPLVLSWSAANAVDVNCNGGNDGSITVNAAGGTGIISYKLQPGNVTNANGIFNNLIAGIYTLTATDANGCSLTITLQVSQAPPITWLTATAVNVTCNGGSDGSIAVTATGGTGILNYTLQPNNITNVSGQFTNLIAGVYTVSAVDANGCSTSTVLTITEPVLLQLTNLANTQPTCVPGNDGSLTVTASGGTPAYTYNIGGANQASNVFLNLGAGNYTVTVTDANGCTASSTITIAAPNSPVISAVLTTDVTCNGGNDGAITTTASGGLGALNYNLQPGNVSNASGVFSNLTAGIYTITVGDANGCTVSSTASVNEPVALTWTSALATDVLCFGGSDGSATVAATGGTGAINYNLQPGNQNNAGGIFANLIAGTYTLT